MPNIQPFDEREEGTEESSPSALFVRQELRIPGDFPDMLIWILEIASIPSIESHLCRFDDLGPGLLRLLHHPVDFFLTADILSQGKVRRTGSLNRDGGIVSNALSWPQSELDTVL